MENKNVYTPNKGLLASYNCNKIPADKLEEVLDNIVPQMNSFVKGEDYLFGYKISPVSVLSKLFEFNVFSVDFIGYDKWKKNDPEGKEKIKELIEKLKEDMEKEKGYYILKTPMENIILISQFNETLSSLMNAGSTVYYVNNRRNNNSLELKNSHLEFKFLAYEEKEKFRNDLIRLTEEGFGDYFGQYNISHITRDKADEIYPNWIRQLVNSDNIETKILMALNSDKPIGYIVINEDEYCVDIVLNTIDRAYWNEGIYSDMVKYICSFVDESKPIIASTQTNNYGSQNAWIKNGFRIFNSFYTFHFNNLKL